MTKITSACEWCGKAMNFFTELKKRCWWKCEKCNDKVEKVVLNDSYPKIIKSLENGKWVIGERAIRQNMGNGFDLDFVVFLFITSKETIRATRSRENVKWAMDDLFSQTWDRKEINEFGFNSLKEISPITQNKK